MRAAAILGPGVSAKHLKPFQDCCDVGWLNGLPQQSEQADVILIFGGDGTIHRYLEKLVRLQLPVLIVPCGSGNDFARALGLRSRGDALSAWRQFLAASGNVKNVDLGVITPLFRPRTSEASAQNSHYFCTVAGLGLDAAVARRANRLPRWLRAHGGYALCLLPALLKLAPVAIIITSREAEGARSPVSERVFLAAFANTAAYGGGMKVAPQAQLDDGKLDVCLVREMHKLKLLFLFPTVYAGRHLLVANVDYFSAEALKIATEHPVDVYADGEYVCSSPFEIAVARAALPVLTPT